MDREPPTEVEGPLEDDRLPEDRFELPSRIGPYRILRRLGEGGMGIVYLAEQTEPIARQVAIKVLNPFRDGRINQARFDREIESLATMKHPHIAQVFDAGQDQGRPYYVMEAVDGPSVTEFADREKLDVRERIELFLKVCDGVHHAHQRGIIHRDLKPGNVLVSTAPGDPARPRIIDFGLARKTGVASDLSTTGTAIGTPSYMSPEQLRGLDGTVDTRTDVYALGILLYELLVGSNPFRRADSTSFLELVQRVMDEDAPRPSLRARESGWSGSGPASGDDAREVDRWCRSLQGELDWILLKAIAREPDRRYASVAAFAEDLRRYLGNEPVTAGPPTRRYRARKFVRRHRTAVAVLALTALLLIVAAIGSTLAWRRALASEQRAVASEVRVREAAREAETIRHFLENLLSSVDPSQAGRDVRLLTLLDDRVGSLDRDFGDQPRVEAAVRHILGRTYLALGAHDRAEELLSGADRLRRDHLGGNAPETLDTRHQLARLALAQGRLEVAEERARAAHQGRIGTLGTDHLETEESAFLVALVVYRRGRSDEAYRELDALQSRVGDRGPAGAELALRARQEMAGVLLRRQEYESAEELYRGILAERLRLHGPDHPQTLRSENRLGNAIYRQRRWSEAEEVYRRVATRSAALLGPEHPSTLLALNNVANTLDKQGDYAAAETLFRDTLAQARRTLGDRHPDTLLLLNNLGNSLRHAGRDAEAESSYRLARAYQVDVLGPSHPETLRTVSNLIKVFHRLQLPEEADRLTAEVVQQAEGSPLAWELRASVLEELGRPAEASQARARQRALESPDASADPR